MNTTACVLLYGDYPHLAERCLRPLVRLVDARRIKLRVGMNQVSREVARLVFDMMARSPGDAVLNSPENILKYPMMRRLFGLEEKPTQLPRIESPYVMWFDDDSYIKDRDPVAWLEAAEARMADADMVGSVYKLKAPHSPNQVAWIEAQPWYGGRPVLSPPKFATGGWWMLRSEIVYQHNWPVPDIIHDGGDTMLGELLNQQNLRLANHNAGVAINADAQGRESRAERRGRSGRTPRAGSQHPVDRK